MIPIMDKVLFSFFLIPMIPKIMAGTGKIYEKKLIGKTYEKKLNGNIPGTLNSPHIKEATDHLLL